jgi:hypothetical protein
VLTPALPRQLCAAVSLEGECGACVLREGGQPVRIRNDRRATWTPMTRARCRGYWTTRPSGMGCDKGGCGRGGCGCGCRCACALGFC